MPRLKKEKRTKKQIQAEFLEELLKCANITASAKKAKIDRKQIYRWKKEDPKFLEAFNEAVSIGIDALESEAIRRAYEGTEKPIFQGGKKVGTVREYSDTLLIFLLKGRKPEVYKERHEHTGKDGEAIEQEITVKVIHAGPRPVSSEKDVDL